MLRRVRDARPGGARFDHYRRELEADGWTVEGPGMTNFIDAERNGWQFSLTDEGPRPGEAHHFWMYVTPP